MDATTAVITAALKEWSGLELTPSQLVDVVFALSMSDEARAAFQSMVAERVQMLSAGKDSL